MMEKEVLNIITILAEYVLWQNDRVKGKARNKILPSKNVLIKSKTLKKQLAAFTEFLEASNGKKQLPRETINIINVWLTERLLPYVDNDNSVDIDAFRALQLCNRLLKTFNANNVARLEKYVVSLSLPVKLTSVDIEDFEMSNEEATMMVAEVTKFFTGKAKIRMTEEERAAANKKDPQRYQMYLKATNLIAKTSRAAVRNFIRLKGKDGLAEYSATRDYLFSMSYTHYLPATKNWDGLIDENCNLYTESGLKIKNIPYTTIVGNPEYVAAQNNTFVFSCVTPNGNTQYFYTEEAVKGWREERFEAVDNFTPMIASVRSDWLKRIRSKNTKEQRLAILLEMLYWCSARIGSANNEAAGVKTFGISTLRGQHIRFLSNKLVVEYIGKTGVKQKHVLVPTTPQQKYIVKTLLEWKAEGGASGVLFDLKGNYEVPPSNSTVNTFFRACGAPSDVSVHKLRHARATSMMMQLLKSKQMPYVNVVKNELKPTRDKPDQREAEMAFRTLAKEIGAELGHSTGEQVTEMTALANYINPTLTLNFFKTLGLRLPTWAKRFK